MHDQQFEALADSLARRLWQSVILPGVGLQCVLLMACSWTLCATSLLADDDDDDDAPTVIIARFPEEGIPPAPSVEKAAANDPAAPATAAPATATPALADVAEATPEKPADVQAGEKNGDKPSAPPAAAEVASDAQVEQLAEPAAPPTEVRELSVEPILETRPKLPADRPAWVGAANDTSERVHRLYVASFTADKREAVEADDMLDEPMVSAVRRYLDETVFPGEGALKLPITPEFIRQNLLDKSTSYVATMTTQSGTEYQKWVVLQVTPEQRDYLGGLLREHKQLERMTMLGVSLFGMLALTWLANLLFTRRRRRYPDTMTPVTMAIMPGNGQGGHANGGSGNEMPGAVHYVAAAAPAPLKACKSPRSTRSCFRRSLIMVGVVVAVFVFILPAIVVKTRRHHPHRTEHTRIEIDGRVWEFKATRPLTEQVVNDHD